MPTRRRTGCPVLPDPLGCPRGTARLFQCGSDTKGHRWPTTGPLHSDLWDPTGGKDSLYLTTAGSDPTNVSVGEGRSRVPLLGVGQRGGPWSFRLDGGRLDPVSERDDLG